jgi:NIMA-interacting peptidyl-prolyl cis-trans isomerase 1
MESERGVRQRGGNLPRRPPACQWRPVTRAEPRRRDIVGIDAVDDEDVGFSARSRRPLLVVTTATSLACGGCLAVAGAKRARRPDEPAKVTAQHVLVKYAGAKKAAPTVTRTREQACLRAEEARAKLEQGSSFADVVNAYSEEPGAATRGGSLGPIERAHVVPPFADAAFELRAGEVSHVVETDYGFHIILRTE